MFSHTFFIHIFLHLAFAQDYKPYIKNNLIIFFSKPNLYFTEIIVCMCFTISLFYGDLIKSINQSILRNAVN